jgi:dihydroorotate dehydrogenase (fumarate)
MKTKIAGIEFNSYTLNASGIKDTTFEELEAIAKSNSSAITMKSCTVKPREGNPEPRCAETPLGLIQSMGWPNSGYKKYLEFVSLLKEKYDKPIIASIAGFSIEDYVEITSAFQNSTADLLEVSLSCPNLENHPQVGYNFKETRKLLSQISNLGSKPLGLKLPPYLDSIHQEEIAKIIKEYGISFITCINSAGNSLIINPETETPVIVARKGFGGLSGDYIKPMALGNVRGFYELLKDEVAIFGVGGIKSGVDAFEFLLAGADAVQIGTTFEREGIDCFQRINKELEEILNKKGYSSIAEAKGKLKYL